MHPYGLHTCYTTVSYAYLLTTPDAYEHSYGNTYEVTLIGEGAEVRILRPLEPFYFQEREPEMSRTSKLTHKDEASTEGFFPRGAGCFKRNSSRRRRESRNVEGIFAGWQEWEMP